MYWGIISDEMRQTQTKTITMTVDEADKVVSIIERLLACPVNVPEEDIAPLKDISDRMHETPVNMIF